MLISYLIVLLLCAHLNTSNAQSKNNKCSTFQSRADRFFKKLLFIGEEPKLPKDDNGVLDYCKQLRKGLGIIKRHQTCLKPFPQQVLGLVLRGAKRSTGHVCDDQARRAEVITHLACLEGKRLDKAYAMMRRALNVLDYIAYNATDDKQLFPFICCSYHFVTDRVNRFIQRECPSKSAETVHFLNEIINISAKEIIDLGCSKTATLKTCEDKHPDVLKQIKAARFSQNIRLQDKSFVKPILAIADRLSPPEDKKRNN